MASEKQTLWTQTGKVNLQLSNPQKRLGLVGLLNFLQEAAWEHATHLDHGYDELAAKGAIWVLTRQKLVMDHWPAWGEPLGLQTWVRPFDGFLAWRDFHIFSGERLCGRCATEWVSIDLRRRRPTRLDIGELMALSRSDLRVDFDAPKLEAPGPWEALARFEVRNSDLDLYEHVNNTRYAQWILDAVPREWHQTLVLKAFEINFLAETRLGDAVEVQAGPLEALDGLRRRSFQGLRAADGKPVFLARCTVEGGAA